jgi:hypothetical protein
MAALINFMVFWVMTPCTLAQLPNISEEYTASFFREMEATGSSTMCLSKRLHNVRNPEDHSIEPILMWCYWILSNKKI